MEIRKTLELQASDFMEFISRIFGKLFVIIPAATILLFLAVNLSGNELSLQSMIFPVGLAAMLTLGFFFLLKNKSKKALTAFHSANGDVSVVINETGVSTTGKLGVTNLAWRNMFRVIETKTVFFFYIHKTNAIVLPKRQLSADELAATLALITKEAKPNKMRLLSVSERPL